MPQRMTKRSVFLFLAALIALWIFLFRDFFSSASSISGDSLANFEFFKYFYNNLFNGVIPLWDPFIYLGRPHVASFLSGALNILVLPIYLLHFLGVDYYNLYLIYLALYFLLGVWGFFLLSAIILKDNSYALIAAAFLTCSGLTAVMFNQIFLFVLFVPATWFFVFFFNFFKDFKRYHFWGMVCSLMVMGVSYYPFYFICLFAVFLIFYILLFWREASGKISRMIAFIDLNKIVTALGLFFVVTAFIPLFLFNMVNSSGEIISPARHQCETADDCHSQVSMSYEEAAFFGTFGERFAGGAIFSHLDKFSCNNDSFVYVPTVAFILVLLAMLTVTERKTQLIFAMGTAVFLISLGGITPIYKLLFDHVFFFKFFRNLFFFAAYLIPLFILFAVAQFKSLVEQLAVVKGRLLPLALIVFGHAAFYYLLNFQGNVIPATYIATLLSLVFFILLWWGAFHGRPLYFLFFFFVVVLIEPVQVFQYYLGTARPISDRLPRDHRVPEFNYVRPVHDESTAAAVSAYSMIDQLADFKDSAPAAILQADYLNSHVFDSYSAVSMGPQGNRAQNKIVVYDHPPADGDWETPVAIVRDSPDFQVLRFDVNSLKVKTHFSVSKFLVYRDAYSVFWKVFINGKESKVQLSEKVFKGVVIPSGENIIEFRYMPPGGQAIYFFILITMLAAFLMLVYFGSKNGEARCC